LLFSKRVKYIYSSSKNTAQFELLIDIQYDKISTRYSKITIGVEFMLITILASLIIIIDQITKYLIRTNLILFEKINIIDDYFYFTFVKNRGAAFGIMQGQRIFFIAVTLFFLIFILYLYQKELTQNLFSKIAVSFLIGGSIANLIDRVTLHYVTDFIAVDIIPFYQFPVINIADVFVFCGVFLLIFELLFTLKS
jgi:signal peptidase II